MRTFLTTSGCKAGNPIGRKNHPRVRWGSICLYVESEKPQCYREVGKKQDAESDGQIDCEHLRKLSNLGTTQVEGKKQGGGGRKRKKTTKMTRRLQNSDLEVRHVRFESVLTPQGRERTLGKRGEERGENGMQSPMQGRFERKNVRKGRKGKVVS